jgi:cobalt-zinc-cadmium efflux system outer membrane protein
MRSTFVPLICVAGCLAGGAATAQTDAVPARLSLAEAVRIAEQRNPTLDTARQQVLVADAETSAARRWPNPLASIESAGYGAKSTPSGFWDRQELTIQVEQEFELAGRRRLRGEAAGAAASATRAGLDNRLRQLHVEVQRVYFQLVLARLDAEQARASLAEIDQVIAVSRSRYKQGEVSGGELRRLEVERLKFSEDALQAELATRHSRSTLLALLGAPRLDQPLEPIDTLAAPGGWTEGVVAPDPHTPGAASGAAALTSQALASRADITAARQEQVRAQAELGLQRALGTPNLSVTGGYRRDFGANGIVLGVAIPLPLLDRNASGISRAEAGQRLAGSLLKEREVAVSLEVQQAFDLVDINRERVTSIERDYLQKAREARDAVLAAYRAGEADLLDYLDAQRAYRDVQRTYNRALFDHRMSLLLLDAAVGAGAKGLLP